MTGYKKCRYCWGETSNMPAHLEHCAVRKATAQLPAGHLDAVATARVQLALERIERAQNELGAACSELSSLLGGVPVWNATGKLCDKVKALWYRVEHFRRGGRFKLDSLSAEAEARRYLERLRAKSIGA